MAKPDHIYTQYVQDTLQPARELKQITCCLLLDVFCISLCTQISISLQIRSEYLILPKEFLPKVM